MICFEVSTTILTPKKKKVSTTILSIILEIRRLANSLQSVKWSWIPQSIDKADHAAASNGIRDVAQVCWAKMPPPSLQGVLEADGLPGPPN